MLAAAVRDARLAGRAAVLVDPRPRSRPPGAARRPRRRTRPLRTARACWAASPDTSSALRCAEWRRKQRNNQLAGEPHQGLRNHEPGERRISGRRGHLGLAHRARRRQDEPRGAARGRTRVVLLHGAVARAERGRQRARAASRRPRPWRSSPARASSRRTSSSSGRVPGIDQAAFEEAARERRRELPDLGRAQGQRRHHGRRDAGG